MRFATGMIMSMARAAATFAEAETTGVMLHRERCLHRLNVLSTCANCVDACPVDALRLEPQDDGRANIVLDPETCMRCGMCIPLCPVGAIESDQGTEELLACVARHEKRHLVELACALHPTPEQGPSQSDLVICTRGCLTGLGVSTITSLYSLGVCHVLLRVDACEACPLGSAKAQICRHADQVKALFAGDSPVTLVETVSGDWPTRRVIAAKAPSRTRRDFLRSLATVQEVPEDVQQLMLEKQPQEAKQPPAERRRLLKALALLPTELLSGEPLAAFPATMIAAKDTCNACRVCEYACPTGAIGFDNDDHHFCLTFSAGACTNCGACLDLCEPAALRRDRTPTLNDWLTTEPCVLRRGELRYCRKCGTAFDGRSESSLCDVCDFRRKNPFGTRLPTWFEGRRTAPNINELCQ